MGISGVCGGAEELEIFGKADTVTVSSVTNKPHMAPSISSSSTSSSESVIDPVKMSYGMNGEEEEEFEWVAVDKEIDLITDKAPELDEVDDAFSALQL